MLKKSLRTTIVLVCILSFMLAGSFNCTRNKGPFNPVIPGWLNEKIEEMENHNYYYGTKIYRHRWKASYYYHIQIPASSCMYCELYDKTGNKMVWDAPLLEDYLQNRSDKTIVWRWSEE